VGAIRAGRQAQRTFVVNRVKVPASVTSFMWQARNRHARSYILRKGTLTSCRREQDDAVNARWAHDIDASASVLDFNTRVRGTMTSTERAYDTSMLRGNGTMPTRHVCRQRRFRTKPHRVLTAASCDGPRYMLSLRQKRIHKTPPACDAAGGAPAIARSLWHCTQSRARSLKHCGAVQCNDETCPRATCLQRVVTYNIQHAPPAAQACDERLPRIPDRGVY
jgi:hypothetical protein